MVASLTTPAAAPAVARAFRRVAVGFRAVGAAWLLALAAVSAGVGELTRPAVVWGTAALAVGWAAATVALARRPEVLRGWPWLLGDQAVATWTVLGPVALGEAAAIAGGYPFSAVVLAAWARGLPGAVAAAVLQAAVALLRVGFTDRLELPLAVQNVLFYVVATGVVLWAVGLLTAGEARRTAAEAALADERAERARAQERAETAAHLHDSVLQTLALIQRRSEDPAEVRALARRQEGELRTWLWPAARPAAGGSAHASLRALAHEVEDDYGVVVEVVTTGEAPSAEAAAPLLAAAREALVNAAKHAGVERVAVYAEAEGDGALRVFVRDRGRGFDPGAVAPDRRGIRESITARMARHGGVAEIRAHPGGGAEVQLALPATVEGPVEPAG